MAHLVTFTVDGVKRPGALKNDRVLDLQAAGLPVGKQNDLLAIAQGGNAVAQPG